MKGLTTQPFMLTWAQRGFRAGWWKKKVLRVSKKFVPTSFNEGWLPMRFLKAPPGWPKRRGGHRRRKERARRAEPKHRQ